MRLLFVGDVFARAGLRMVEEHIPRLRDELELELVVANGENLADGAGITSRQARRLLACGVDAITLGNHAFRRAEVHGYLGAEPRIVRPANMASRSPGHGSVVVTSADGFRLGVLSLMGSLYLDPAVSPFEVAEQLVDDLRSECDAVLVDMHAEATSEKVAMGRLLRGKAMAVVGTHTHVQTSDATLLPGGTAYITDAGMTGPHDSVIGVRAELVLQRFATGTPVRFEPADGGVRLEGAVIEFGRDGRATAIESFRLSE